MDKTTERNSELAGTKKFAWGALAASLLLGLGATAQFVMDSASFDAWPWVGGLLGVMATMAKLGGDYIRSRPGKTLAENEKRMIRAKIAAGITDPN